MYNKLRKILFLMMYLVPRELKKCKKELEQQDEVME